MKGDDIKMGTKNIIHNKINKVFLGGTVSGVDPLYGWRGKLVAMLKILFFNPVLRKYDKEAKAREPLEKASCNLELYVITPDIRGFFSIFEVTKHAILNPKNTIFCILEETFENDKIFTKPQIQSLKRIASELKQMGVPCFYNLEDVANYLNNFKED